MDETFAVSAGLLAMITLELLKLAVRKWYVKSSEYDFKPYFYNLSIPFLTALWSVALAYIGWGEPVTYTLQYLVQWAVSMFVMLAAYNLGLAPMKEYAREYKDNHL